MLTDLVAFNASELSFERYSISVDVFDVFISANCIESANEVEPDNSGISEEEIWLSFTTADNGKFFPAVIFSTGKKLLVKDGWIVDSIRSPLSILSAGKGNYLEVIFVVRGRSSVWVETFLK